MTGRALAAAVALTAIAFALSPIFTPGFAGYRPEQFPVIEDFWPIQPAGWAFAIWGLIYLWLIAGAVWGLLRAAESADWQAGRGPLLISLAIGVFWIAAANASPLAATVMIVVMAFFAVLALLRSGREATLWQSLPMALYAGWLTAASGVGTGVVIIGYGVLPAQIATLSMLVLMLAVGLWVQVQRPGAWAYTAALIWALSGVIAANWPMQNWAVIGPCGFGIIALTAMALRQVAAGGRLAVQR